tara:strand:+ start:721 stop:1578 length:858 start_codon:yes stop_codon:yes gene_type:complete
MKKVQTGQVIEFYSNTCLVKTNFGEFSCVAIKNVVVGDYVELEIIQDSKKTLGKILKVVDRKSKISKRIGNKNKLFAANVTHVGILVTPSPKTSSEFIDKWIIKSKTSKISPFIINNKTDIESSLNYDKKLEIYSNIGLKVMSISAKHNINIDEVVDYLKDKCVLFVGNSGAGKSTLTSKVVGKKIKTNSLSNDQGVHTTSISSLYEAKNGLKIIDSPGMRDIELADYSINQITKGFEEIYNASKYCKFNDCNHIDNDGCNVANLVSNGQINISRYNNFIKFISK